MRTSAREDAAGGRGLSASREIAGRDSYVFRCIRSSGDRWTFVVYRQALEEPDPSAADRDLIFERYRAQIYLAARRRMERGKADQQHVLTTQDIISTG